MVVRIPGRCACDMYVCTPIKGVAADLGSEGGEWKWDEDTPSAANPPTFMY